MRVLALGTHFVYRNLSERYAKKLEFTFLPVYDGLSLAELNSIFKKQAYDAVLFIAPDKTKENSAAFRLQVFRNLQYICTLNKCKLIYCTTDVGQSTQLHASEQELQVLQNDDACEVANNLIIRLAHGDSVTTVLRLFTVYGKYQSPQSGFVSQAIHDVILGRKAKKIRVPYDQIINLTYVDDTTKIICKALLGQLPKDDYNACTYETVSLVDVAKQIKKIAKKYEKEAEILMLSDQELPEHSADNAKILSCAEDLDFVSVKNGITRLFKLYIEDKTLLERGE